jgi:Zn finger protein HypA/HybF involved in hydrogenase expression
MDYYKSIEGKKDLQQVKKYKENKISKNQLEEYFINRERAWDTDFWKKLRKEKLSVKCEYCNSKKALTIQHTQHPIPLRIIFNCFKQSWINKNYLSKLSKTQKYSMCKDWLESIAIKRLSCNKCKSITISQRKDKSYYCNRCKNKNFEPINKLIHPTAKKDVKEYIQAYGYERVIYKAMASTNTDVGLTKAKIEDLYNNSLNEYLIQVSDYIEMKHIKTLCNSCAYREDYKNNKIVDGTKFISADMKYSKELPLLYKKYNLDNTIQPRH